MWVLLRRVGLGLVILTLMAAPWWLAGYAMHILILSLLAVILGVSYRPLLLGGEASFCHGAFYGIGSYVTAILAVRYGVEVWLLAIVAAAAAAVVAFVLGAFSLRTRGPYFFLITFGFLMVFDSFISNMQQLTGGYSGISNIPPPLGVGAQWQFYYVILSVTIAIIAVFAYLDRAVFGLEIRALGQSDQLAEAVGVPRTRHLLAAFVIGAAAAGIGGAFYASYISFVSPSSFSIWVSISVLTYNIVGGFHTLMGPVLGAASVTLVPLAFGWSSELIQIFVAASIVAMMMFFPSGLEGFLDAITLRVGPSASPEVTRTARPEPTHAGRSIKPAVKPGLTQPVLHVQNLQFGFGGVRIANGIDMKVGDNEIVGLIGPNGAGKSTLFNLLSGVLRPESGSIRLPDREIGSRPPSVIARSGLVRTFQSTAVFEKSSVFDNVLVAALRAEVKHRRLGTWRRRHSLEGAYREAEECLSLVRLDHLSSRRAGDLPYGAKKMLGMAAALAAQPQILCLDEPVTGLTGHEVQEFIKAIRRIKQDRDCAILLVEHRMPVVMELCERVYVLYDGAICAEGEPREVVGNETVRRIYLG